MAYPTITPDTSLPPENSAGTDLYGYDSAEIYLDCSAGSGTACLLIKGPNGKYKQYEPTWPVDTTTAGQAVGRISIPRERNTFRLLITGGPTIDAAYIVGVTRGR